MISEQTKAIAVRAKAIYADRLQAILEAENRSRFVAIEPTSGEHFLADSFGQAVAAARAAYPDRIAFVIRVGHDAAIQIGGVSN
jgi:hypothetical protein